ncbi:hypothetical protein KCP76_15625 [Salmonella enterica subsp. enterica serovar Weltevreden]|nr:hypothetical protein KCP76_15625 [Salmonella enterica subsp. enterica serovar Weltevreden]
MGWTLRADASVCWVYMAPQRRTSRHYPEKQEAVGGFITLYGDDPNNIILALLWS